MYKLILVSLFICHSNSWSSNALLEQLLGNHSNPQERHEAFRALRSNYQGPIDSYSFIANLLSSPGAQDYLPLNHRIYHELIKSFSFSLSPRAYVLDSVFFLTDPAIANISPIEMIKILKWEREESLFLLKDEHWKILLKQALHNVFERMPPMAPHDFFLATQLPDDRYLSDSIFFEQTMAQYFFKTKESDEFSKLLLEFLNQHFVTGNLEEDQMLTVSGLISRHVKRKTALAAELKKIAIYALMRLVDDKFLAVKIDLIDSALGLDVNDALDMDTGLVRDETIASLLTSEFKEVLLPINPSSPVNGCFQWGLDMMVRK